jgi:hypothetical protein
MHTAKPPVDFLFGGKYDLFSKGSPGAAKPRASASRTPGKLFVFFAIVKQLEILRQTQLHPEGGALCAGDRTGRSPKSFHGRTVEIPLVLADAADLSAWSQESLRQAKSFIFKLWALPSGKNFPPHTV